MIQRLEVNGGGMGDKERERRGERVEGEGGAEDRVVILDFLEGILENSKIRGLVEEEGQNGNSSTAGSSFAPAVFCASDWSELHRNVVGHWRETKNCGEMREDYYYGMK